MAGINLISRGNITKRMPKTKSLALRPEDTDSRLRKLVAADSQN